MYRHSDVNKLFWGLLLVLLNFKINGFDILNDTLGLIIMAVGLYNLSHNNKLFSKSFYAVLLNLGWQIFCLVFKFSSIFSTLIVTNVITIIGIVLNILLLYFVLTALAELAVSQDLKELSTRLKIGIIVYIISVVFFVLSLLIIQNPLLYIIVDYAFYIYILVQVRSAYSNLTIYTPEQQGLNRQKNHQYVIATIISIILPVVLAVGVIALSEIQVVHTEMFNNRDSSVNPDTILSIRSHMIELGFNSNVVDSMPDSEVLNYQNITTVQKCVGDEILCDGGKLVISQYVSSFDWKNYRYTIFYEWLEKPKLSHQEAIGINLNNLAVRNNIVHLNQTSFSSQNLYDIKKDGITHTYSSSDIKVNENLLNTVKSFKLAGQKNAVNYRGYMAFNHKLSIRTNGYSIGNFYYYIHQRTIFNSRGIDLTDFNKDRQSFGSTDEDLFIKEYNNMDSVIMGEPYKG